MYAMNDRNQTRQLFFDAWEKFHAKQPLSDLEQQILQVILEHPEYHYLFQAADKYKNKDFLPELGETNPYMHMSIHLAIRDQIGMNLPLGIRDVFEKLCARSGDKLTAEHEVMECFTQALWEMMHYGKPFDNEAYLQACYSLLT